MFWEYGGEIEGGCLGGGGGGGGEGERGESFFMNQYIQDIIDKISNILINK